MAKKKANKKPRKKKPAPKLDVNQIAARIVKKVTESWDRRIDLRFLNAQLVKRCDSEMNKMTIIRL